MQRRPPGPPGPPGPPVPRMPDQRAQRIPARRALVPARDYRAAGIFPLALHHGRVFLLVGSEPRQRRDAQAGPHGGVWWLAFGGKIEPGDRGNAQTTALREFHEESGHALGNPLRLLGKPCWDPQAKYLLFPAEIAYQHDLPRFSDADAARDSTLNKRELRWIDARAAIEGLTSTGLWDGDRNERLPVKPWFVAFLMRERKKLLDAVFQVLSSDTQS